MLITGEVDRTTEFERGMPNHEAWRGGRWEPDPLIVDEQALVVHVRGRGLVVLTGCGHAGAVNIARHAMRLTGVDRLHALLGGFHLTGPAFEPVIEPTVNAFRELAPDVVVPAHCTGWTCPAPVGGCTARRVHSQRGGNRIHVRRVRNYAA